MDKWKKRSVVDIQWYVRTGNGIGAKGMMIISEGLKTNNTLTELSLKSLLKIEG